MGVRKSALPRASRLLRRIALSARYGLNAVINRGTSNAGDEIHEESKVHRPPPFRTKSFRSSRQTYSLLFWKCVVKRIFMIA